MIFAFFISGMLLSFVCNKLLLRFSQSLGIRNKNDIVIRWSNESKPSLGGVSFFVVFIFSAIAYTVVGEEENVFRNLSYSGFFVAASLAFLMGLADDAYNTKPFLKLFIQISCGLLLGVSGTVIDLTHVFSIDLFVTVIWVVAVMNSLNMLDNMDGITGTAVLFVIIACLFGGWIVYGPDKGIWTIPMVSMLGALLGFLRCNIHPSRIFMGDAGSQFIGLFVAFFAIKFLWNIGPITQNHSWTGIIVALVAFTPAAADTLTVVINRLRRGQSPMVGGKDHTTHHLVYAGYSDRQVWYIFVIISALSALLALGMIYLIKIGIIVPMLVFVLYFALVFFYLYRNTRKYPEPKF